MTKINEAVSSKEEIIAATRAAVDEIVEAFHEYEFPEFGDDTIVNALQKLDTQFVSQVPLGILAGVNNIMRSDDTTRRIAGVIGENNPKATRVVQKVSTYYITNTAACVVAQSLISHLTYSLLGAALNTGKSLEDAVVEVHASLQEAVDLGYKEGNENAARAVAELGEPN